MVPGAPDWGYCHWERLNVLLKNESIRAISQRVLIGKDPEPGDRAAVNKAVTWFRGQGKTFQIPEYQAPDCGENSDEPECQEYWDHYEVFSTNGNPSRTAGIWQTAESLFAEDV